VDRGGVQDRRVWAQGGGKGRGTATRGGKSGAFKARRMLNPMNQEQDGRVALFIRKSA